MAYSVGGGSYEVRGEGRDAVAKIHGDVEWWCQLRLRFELQNCIDFCTRITIHVCLNEIKICFFVHSANDQ